VPTAAVNQGPKGAFVYLVVNDPKIGAKVVAQPVTVSTTQGGFAVIQSGLAPGQSVVTDGQMSLKPNAPVCQAGQCGKGGHGKGGGPS
jgi:multidrug efflux system membrane fusion protein